jgi:chromate transporter
MVTKSGKPTPEAHEAVSLATIAREWSKLGCIGFGGPPAHIVLLRRLCVEERHWLDPGEFEDAIATTNLLPGPASTQLAIYCAWKLRGARGALIGGLCFICPGLILIIALSVIFLAKHPPAWVLGAASGAGAAVPAVALSAARGLAPASWQRVGIMRAQKLRWISYAVAGALSAALFGEYLVITLVVCGVVEIFVRRLLRSDARRTSSAVMLGALHTVALGGIASLGWVAFKVGALSYGGGFVIIPLMEHDAVLTYHWMSAPQFLYAVALGQVTPGPVVQTVAVVGYAAAGIGGALLAAAVAFAPSFGFILAGGSKFDTIRANNSVEAFLTGAGPAVIGAIAGSAIPLGLSLGHLWQLPILAGAALWLLVARRGVVTCLLGAGAVGVICALAGARV